MFELFDRIFARMFANKGMMNFLELGAKKNQKDNLIAGLNLLEARVRIQNTRRFNQFCAKYELTREEAKNLMLNTLGYFEKQVKGGKNDGKTEKCDRA